MVSPGDPRNDRQPLRLILKESRRLGDDARTALLKLVMVIHRGQGNSFYDPEAPLLAAAWEGQYGAPDWERLQAFADGFAADPENAPCMARLLEMHAAQLGRLEDRYRDELMAAEE